MCAQTLVIGDNSKLLEMMIEIRFISFFCGLLQSVDDDDNDDDCHSGERRKLTVFWVCLLASLACYGYFHFGFRSVLIKSHGN